LLHDEKRNEKIQIDYNIQVHQMASEGKEIWQTVHQEISKGESHMGIMKAEWNEHRIIVEPVEEGLKELSMYGKKSFQDHTGEWVSVTCPVQMNLFDEELTREDVIPHVVEG